MSVLGRLVDAVRTARKRRRDAELARRIEEAGAEVRRIAAEKATPGLRVVRYDEGTP